MTNISDSIELFFTETESLAATGNLTEARQQLQELINRQDLIKARAYNDSGVICYRQGAKEKALENYLKAIELAPQESVYRKNLADLYYFEFGEIETALAHYRQILADDPRDFDASLAIGRICADLGKHFLNEAKDFFALAGKIRPDDELLAKECRKLGDSSIADGKFTGGQQPQKISADGGDPGDKYIKLSSDFQSGQEPETEKKLLTFLKQYPDFALAHNDLGVISHQLEKFDQAGRCYREAVRLAPENTTFRKNLADFIFIIEKQPEEAMPHYHEALKANPKDLETLMMIGNICLALGSQEEARNFFNLVLDIEPWNLDASKALEMLDEKD